MRSQSALSKFSRRLPNCFSENDSRVLQRLAETVLAAVNRAARAEDLRPGRPQARPAICSGAGSVLFASAPEPEKKMESSEEKLSGGISLPRSHLIILVCAAAAIFLVLGDASAPWIQSKLQGRGHSPLETVLASSQPPKSEGASPAAPPTPSIETASLAQLRQMAEKGDPAAENALGLRYFQGDDKNGIGRDEKEAFGWFRRAAEHGSLPAQAKLGRFFWGGRGVPKDLNEAYFWTVLARARGEMTVKPRPRVGQRDDPQPGRRHRTEG